MRPRIRCSSGENRDLLVKNRDTVVAKMTAFQIGIS